MSVQFPTVHAVIALIPQILPAVQKLHEGDFVDPAQLAVVVENTSKLHLLRLDDPDKPMLKIDDQGRVTLYMVWGHPKNYTDPNFIVALACPEQLDSEGKKMFKPEMMMRGDKANVMIVGGMSCCGSSVQTHVSKIGNEEATIDMSGIPLGGLPHAEHNAWLKGKVHVVKSAEGQHSLIHLVQDVLAHRFPDNPDIAHDCDTSVDYVQYAAKARNDLVIT